MSNLLVTSSVTPSVNPTTFNANTTLARNQTAAQAVNIGNLQEQSTIIDVTDAGSNSGVPVSSNFTLANGDALNLSSSFHNFVDQASTRIQLFDSNGNVIADNQGSKAQQQAYTQLISTGLSPGAGTFTVVATPEPGVSAPAMTVNKVQQQGTSLSVNSQLTDGDANEYYNFSFSAGNNLKLSFDAGSGNPSTRVQLLSSSGNIVADSDGNSFQKANYYKLTSGTGLSATTGNYTVKVSYAPGADTTQNIKYNMQLYSGKNYAVVYNTNATAQAADYSAAGSVTATDKALAYSRQSYNTIGETAASAVNIGWMAQDKSSLQVLSQLTQADSADVYSFTLQSGDNLKFGFDATKTPNASDLRVQLYDGSGTYLIADSAGTPAQQAAYKSLTTTDGLASKPGQYSVKISYASGAPTTSDQYQFNFYSGTSYAAVYTTIASAQTYGNALLSGSLGASTTAASGIAAYLSGASSTGGSILGLIASGSTSA